MAWCWFVTRSHDVQVQRVAFPTRICLWYTTKSRLFCLVVFENFQNLSLKCLWDGRASAVTWYNPIPPYWRLSEVACTGASVRTLWGELGYATLQSMPEPCHKHFSGRFWKFSKTTSKKHRDFVVYHKGLFLVGNATRKKISFECFANSTPITSFPRKIFGKKNQ